MKKFLMICAALLMVASAFAAVNEGSWSGTAVTTSGDSATMKVSFDLDSSDDGEGGEDENASIKIGFTSDAVTSIEATVTSESTATLSTEKGKGVLAEDRYIYWQIASSSSGITIALSWDEQMTGDTETNKLGWTITTTPAENSGSGVYNGDGITDENTDYEGVTVFDRSKIENLMYGTVGSQKLTIETEALSTAAIDNYSGTLTLAVSAN